MLSSDFITVRDGIKCDNQCTADGCWGKGPNQCLACANFHLDDTCIGSCDSHLGYDSHSLP